jgi:hypothetical protein
VASHHIMRSICLLLFLFIACSQAPSSKPVSDREHDGFAGPVKKVFVEWSPVYRPWGNIPIGSRCREMTKHYDENGRLMMHSTYPGSCGSDERREEYTYAPDGSRTAKAQEIRGKDSPPPPPPMATGSNTKQETGEPRTTFKYGPSGLLIEEASLRPSGKVIYKYTYTYDAKNRMLEMTGYNSDGRVSDRRVYGYAGDNRAPSEFAYYGPDGKAHERTTYSEYEFNSRGDWIKRKETSEETFNRKSISIVSREIEYYSPK